MALLFGKQQKFLPLPRVTIVKLCERKSISSMGEGEGIRGKLKHEAIYETCGVLGYETFFKALRDFSNAGPGNMD